MFILLLLVWHYAQAMIFISIITLSKQVILTIIQTKHSDSAMGSNAHQFRS